MVDSGLRAVGAVAVVLALAYHGLATAAASDGFGLTNIAGGPNDCVAPTRNGVCSQLFDGREALYPGHGEERAVTLAYHGLGTAAVGMYLTRFTSRASTSRALCREADPAALLDVEVRSGARTLYSGTLSDLAAVHGAPISAVQLGRWPDGRSETLILDVTLDASAGNDDMGCVSTADFVWIAE